MQWVRPNARTSALCALAAGRRRLSCATDPTASRRPGPERLLRAGDDLGKARLSLGG
jgi:hypothetical protein